MNDIALCPWLLMLQKHGDTDMARQSMLDAIFEDMGSGRLNIWDEEIIQVFAYIERYDAALWFRVIQQGLRYLDKQDRERYKDLLRHIPLSRLHPTQSTTNNGIASPRTHQGHAENGTPFLQTMTELLEEDLPPLHYIVDGLIHEGLWIFGGKSKRGKSWLMLDLAMAVTAGRSAIGHFRAPKAPVLYLALEDGKRRVKDRAKKIEPDIQQRDFLHLAYKFPRLQDGAVDHLRTLIDLHNFKLIIIDVAAKLTTANGKNTDIYMQVYEELGALHDLCEEKHLAIILLDHLRKQQADDIFDEIQGSVAKQGVADALMVLDRKPDSNDALLHIRSKEAEDATHAIEFHNNAFRYIGEGEAHKLAKERYDILNVLVEQQSPMGIVEIMRAMALENNSANYQRVRRTLITLEDEDFVKRITHRGALCYLATIRAKSEGLPSDYDDSVPF